MWRIFRNFLLNRRRNAAILIQRMARKTILRSNSQSFLKIDMTLNPFTPMRHKLLTDFQVKVAYYYRKHLKRVKEKRRLEEEKRKKKLALQAKKGKKGAKSKKGKKASKAATLTPAKAKEIANDMQEGIPRQSTQKEEKNTAELDEIEEPSVNINIGGEPLREEDEDEDKPESQQSKRSKGTAEKKSDFDDEELKRQSMLDLGDGSTNILERESNEDKS